MIVCAGVHADRIAALAGAPREPRIVPFRGDYLRLRPERRHLVRGLVYPVPDPAFPFLGVHTTVRPGRGRVARAERRARARPGGLPPPRRRPAAISSTRCARRASGGSPGVTGGWAARRWPATSARGCSSRPPRRLLPELQREDVLPGPGGIRAQALDADGSLVDDFVVRRGRRRDPRAERALAGRDLVARDRRADRRSRARGRSSERSRARARAAGQRQPSCCRRSRSHASAIATRCASVGWVARSSVRPARRARVAERRLRRTPRTAVRAAAGSRVDSSAFQSASRSIPRLIQVCSGAGGELEHATTSSASGIACGARPCRRGGG